MNLARRASVTAATEMLARRCIRALAATTIVGVLGAAPCANAGSTDGALRAGLPLTPTRTIQFTVDEATGMSVDVSPDGRRLVVDVLGDLYTLPLEGGAARALTRGSAVDRQPKFSPDGRWIAFVSDRDGTWNLWLVRPDGSDLRRLSSESPGPDVTLMSPAWLPDGSAVAVFRAREWEWLDSYPRLPREVRLYSLDGTASRSLTGEGEASIEGGPMGPAFTPDGTALYVGLSGVGPGRYFGERLYPHWQLARIELATGRVTRENAPTGGFRPHVSPDGRWLVYGVRDGAKTALRVRNLASGDEQWLLREITADLQDGVQDEDLVPGFGFVPDGSALVTTLNGGLARVSIPDGRVTPIPFTLEVRQELAPRLDVVQRIATERVRVRTVQQPRLSPDRGRWTFAALGHVWVADRRGTRPRTLDAGTEQFADDPTWTLDGSAIVYSVWSDAAGGHLVRHDLTRGAKPVTLTHVAGAYEDPVPTPDGRGVVVAFQPAALARHAAAMEQTQYGVRDLLFVPFDGGPATVIAKGLWLTGRPHFAHDRDRVYFTERGGRLASVALDGTDPRVGVTIVAGLDRIPASEILLAPDGRRALVETGADLVLLPVDPTGTEVIDLHTDRRGTSLKALARRAGAPRAVYAGYGLHADWRADADAATFAVGAALYEIAFGTESHAGRLARVDLEIDVPGRRGLGTLVLRNARVLTMTDEGVLPRADVFVVDDRIARVVPAGTVPIPRGARTLDLAGKVVAPGFIDTHCHALDLEAKAARGQPWQFLNYLAYGVTTCFDPSTTFLEFTMRDQLASGRVLGPRFFATGPATLPAVGIRSLDDARDFLWTLRHGYGAPIYKEYHPGSRLQRQWLAIAARELGMGAVSETSGSSYALGNVLDGITNHAHSLDRAPLYRDVIELKARSGTGQHGQLTTLRYEGGLSSMYWFLEREDVLADCKLRRFMPRPRLVQRAFRRISAPDEAQRFPAYAAAAQALVAAGVQYGVGDHGEWKGFGLHWEMWSLATGMRPLDVLRAATVTGARTLGLDRDLGTVEPGKLADLVVLNRDPLEDIRATRDLAFVVTGGQVFDAGTLRPVGGDAREVPAPEGEPHSSCPG